MTEVRSFDEAAFAAACAALMQQAIARFGAPEIVIGIRSGGWLVAERMVQGHPAQLLAITCRRPSSRVKAMFPGARAAMAQLPQSALNAMRRLEHRITTYRRKQKRIEPQIDAAELARIGAALRALAPGARVLVVDDAVDSGITLASVLQALRGVAGSGVEFRSAAITVTDAAPLVRPDLALYERVLCRFPWALDAAA